MTGEQMFLNELKDYVNSGMSKNDIKTLINQRLKHLSSVGENDVLHVVSNNEAFKCDKCKDTGIYFFSDRVPENCECKSEVTVCPRCGSNKIAESEEHYTFYDCNHCGLTWAN